MNCFFNNNYLLTKLNLQQKNKDWNTKNLNCFQISVNMRLTTRISFIFVASCTLFATCQADFEERTQKSEVRLSCSNLREFITQVHDERLLFQETSKIESVPYSSPNIRSASIYIAEHFDNINEFNRKWIISKAKKPDVSEDLAQYNGTYS